jgi:hypothetical protein
LVGVLASSTTAIASKVTAPFYAVDFGNANPVPARPCTLKNHETYTGFALPIGAFSGTEDETVEFLSCSPPSLFTRMKRDSGHGFVVEKLNFLRAPEKTLT